MNRKTFPALLALAAFSLSAASNAAGPATDADHLPFYQAGGQYTAVLHAPSQQWRLLPADGDGIDIRPSARCSEGTDIPAGLWLITRDSAGRPELVAPSATTLPYGHSGHVALVPCGQRGPSSALAIPAALIDWLSERSGAVYVEG